MTLDWRVFGARPAVLLRCRPLLGRSEEAHFGVEDGLDRLALGPRAERVLLAVAGAVSPRPAAAAPP